MTSMQKTSPAKTKLPKVRPPNLDLNKEGASSGKTSPTKSVHQSPDGKIPRNVNFYRHVINSTESDIEWMLKLRSPISVNTQKAEQTSTQPFSFDGKGIESQRVRREISDLDGRSEPHKAQHLFLHRFGGTPNQGSVQFETGLRSYGLASDKLRSLEKSWRNEPKKDRNEYPKMYPSYEETAHIKNWSTKNLNIHTHTGLDGYVSLPKYGEQYGRQTKNVSDVKHILKSPGQTMSIADWQLSMRHHGDPKLPREVPEHEEYRKTFLEPKKIARKPKRV